MVRTESDVQLVTDLELLGALGPLPIYFHLARLDCIRCQRARLEKTRRPKPFVEPDPYNLVGTHPCVARNAPAQSEDKGNSLRSGSIVVPQDDWSLQLKKIEREFQGLPPEPSPAFKKLQSEEQKRAQDRAKQRTAMIGGGARLILVGALGVALAFWPYENQCGSGLFGYLAVELVIIVGGLWVAISTWRARLPKMHILSLLIALTGLVLFAIEILPRVGYAAVDAKHPPQFSCPETQNAPPRTSAVEQRVESARSSLQTRWKTGTEELSRQFQPQRDALARLERPELLSQRARGLPRE